jgi:hypothetical protein
LIEPCLATEIDLAHSFGTQPLAYQFRKRTATRLAIQQAV